MHIITLTWAMQSSATDSGRTVGFRTMCNASNIRK